MAKGMPLLMAGFSFRKANRFFSAYRLRDEAEEAEAALHERITALETRVRVLEGQYQGSAPSPGD